MASQIKTSSQSSSQVYDKELWEMFISSMPQFRSLPVPDGENMLEKVLLLSRGNRKEAFKFLEFYKQGNDPDAVQLPSQCPKENIPLKSVEFDNIKVFYHLTWPDHLRYQGGDTWSFYIGRPGTSASQCIDWAKEGIKINAYGPSGEWGECMVLVVMPGARVRITYPFGYGQRTHEIVFPYMDPSIPTTYL